MNLATYVLYYAVIVIYGLCLGYILLNSLAQLNLIYWSLKPNASVETGVNSDSFKWPMVTVQLPVYNEKYVVARLLDAVTQLDYPVNLLEIQILDDSNDETSNIIAQFIAENEHLPIQHIQRAKRQGYKAGALQYGLNRCKGEFIAVFDADFIPQREFLKSALPHFYTGHNIGMVQNKWEHLNRNFSLVTKLQAIGLDAHFEIEQKGRFNAGHFINFNGTAGIWKKSCIENAGGWQNDTLTADLDLSYRAQLKGWKFIYINNQSSPAQLPIAMSAFKAQQYRWTKGSAECMRKLMGKVLLDRNMRFSTKVHAVFHLSNSVLYWAILVSSILSVPLLYIKSTMPQAEPLFKVASLFLISFVLVTAFYWVSYSRQPKINKAGFLYLYPLFLSLSMGMALHNCVAVFEGYIGRKTPFVRTPKFSLTQEHMSFKENNYWKTGISVFNVFELMLAVYFLWAIWLGLQYDNYALMPFHVMLAAGYVGVFLLSVLQLLGQSKKMGNKTK